MTCKAFDHNSVFDALDVVTKNNNKRLNTHRGVCYEAASLYLKEANMVI